MGCVVHGTPIYIYIYIYIYIHTHTYKYGSQVTNDRVRSKMFVILFRSERFKIYILRPSFSSSSHLSSSSLVLQLYGGLPTSALFLHWFLSGSWSFRL